jgi:protein O-mannosyl-transferase
VALSTTSRSIALVVVCIIMTALVYVNIWSGDFQFDDFSTLLENPHLDDWNTFVGHLGHMVRPVLYATFLVDRSLYEHSASGYHLLNLLLHIVSGLLVYRILIRAVNEKARQVPFWTALLFLIHPIQTETVTYTSGRASGLMAFFYLLALFLYIKSSERHPRQDTSRLYFWGAVVCFLLSLGSKETAITFPLALLMWDVLIRRLRGLSLRTTILRRHLLFWLILAVVAAWASAHPRYRDLAHYSFGIRPLVQNLFSELHAVAYAFVLFFCPWKLNLDHDLPIFHSLFQWPLPLDLAAMSGVAMVAFIAARRLPLFTFGAGWWFLQLLPAHSLIPRNDLLSERNLYLASIGLLLMLVLLSSQLAQWLATVLPHRRGVQLGRTSLALALVLALGLFTYERTALYRDDIWLWSDTVQKSPNKARSHNNLGHAYAQRGDWDRAIEEFRTAARLNPDYTLARQNLRNAYLHRVGRRQ